MSKLALDSDGWIVGGPALNVYPPENGKKVEYDGDKDIEPRDPSKHETAWHYNDGNPEPRKTGTNIPPEPSEAKQMLLEKAKIDWGLNRGQLRKLRSKYAILFDYIEARNFEDAKSEADDALDSNDITENQHEYIYDLLDGKITS